jgi:hypothetical protein
MVDVMCWERGRRIEEGGRTSSGSVDSVPLWLCEVIMMLEETEERQRRGRGESQCPSPP